MPIPKCSPKQVYDKKSKKCIEIGSDEYKAIVKKNPSAFKHYMAKIIKATNVTPKCSVTQVYNKKTKRCVSIGGQAYRTALAANPNVFNDQKGKINAFFGTVKTPESPNETLANILKKMKSPTPTKKPTTSVKKMNLVPAKKPPTPVKKMNLVPTKKPPTPVKKMKSPTPAKKPPTSVKKMSPRSQLVLSQLLLKRQPVPKVSAKARYVFMKKAIKILKTKTPKNLKVSDITAIPKRILIKKSTRIMLYHFNYFGGPDMFKKKSKRKREVMTINVSRDNMYDYLYKHILKMNTNPEVIDTNWFVNMQKYIASLTYRQRYALYSYTEYGDVYVNLMERGLSIDPFRVRLQPLFYEIVSGSTYSEFYAALNDGGKKIINSKKIPQFNEMLKDASGVLLQNFYDVLIYNLNISYFDFKYILKLIKNLSDTIHGVFTKAPTTTKPMVVYRGVKDSFFTADNYTAPMKKDEVYVNKGFVSTSILHTIPMRDFMDDSGCCFKVITILPGTKCIPLIGLTHYSTEVEFLLDRNTKYIIRDKYTAKVPLKPMEYLTNDIPNFTIKVSDIIVG